MALNPDTNTQRTAFLDLRDKLMAVKAILDEAIPGLDDIEANFSSQRYLVAYSSQLEASPNAHFGKVNALDAALDAFLA